jgi:hypothetical protein
MRSASLFSIFGLALSLSAALVACSGDDDDDTSGSSGTPSAQGESCARTADCASGLVCLDNRCEKKGSSASGGNAGEGSGTGGSTGGSKSSGGAGGSTGGTSAGSSGKGGSAGSGTVTPPPVLGGEGESCTKAADCEKGLHCFNQRCTVTENTGAGGEAGGTSNPPPSVRLGQQGETCTLSSDCATGLSCLPTQIGGGLGAIGVCSVTSTGIQPTGKTCHAECETAADCCELPPSILTQFSIGSCTDLANKLDGVDCTDPGSSAADCFLQATYCQCDKNTWDCSDMGQCVYTADCTDDGWTTGGCPAKTRSDAVLTITACNSAGKCAAEPTKPVCTKDADCVGEDVFDLVGAAADTCTTGECTCYKPEGNCYRKCGSDLDCEAGKICNSKLLLCEPAPQCTEDLDCQSLHHNVDSICVAGGCVTRCDTDVDCNALTGGSLLQVCGSDHACHDLGCSSNDECTSGTLHMFCADVVTGSGGTVVSSAVTGGSQQ